MRARRRPAGEQDVTAWEPHTVRGRVEWIEIRSVCEHCATPAALNELTRARAAAKTSRWGASAKPESLAFGQAVQSSKRPRQANEPE